MESFDAMKQFPIKILRRTILFITERKLSFGFKNTLSQRQHLDFYYFFFFLLDGEVICIFLSIHYKIKTSKFKFSIK